MACANHSYNAYLWSVFDEYGKDWVICACKCGERFAFLVYAADRLANKKKTLPGIIYLNTIRGQERVGFDDLERLTHSPKSRQKKDCGIIAT